LVRAIRSSVWQCVQPRIDAFCSSLPGKLASHSAFECLSSLRQRDCFCDDRADRAGISQCRDLAKLFSVGLDDEKHAMPPAALVMRRRFALGDRPRQTDEDSRRL